MVNDRRTAWMMVAALVFGGWSGMLLAPASRAATLEEEDAYYKLVTVLAPEAVRDSRDTGWKPPPDGLMLEVSGITELADGRLAVATRKGEIWLISGAGDDPPTNVRYHRFADGLHEPLGLEWRDGAFWTAQRSELTRIADTDGDEVADDYATAAKGWGVTGHYHEYAYGPKPDGDGTFWLTLNTGLNLRDEHLEGTIHDAALGYRQGAWRGWGLEVPSGGGDLVPVCAGLRSPSGLGRNAAGAMFATDQQGNWIATNALVHLRRGGFYGHPESLASRSLPGSPLADVGPVVEGLPWPEAVKRMPFLTPPAVWFPYRKAGQSATDVLLDSSGGRFGPFAGQLFVGEFTQAAMQRVFLEEVDGVWQGACFPFRSGFASAVLRLAQARDGSVYTGLTNRGWSSLGGAAYGLQRLVWTGRTPFEIREMRAKPDGFELVFTLPVDPATASRPESYTLASHTYLYHSKYGSDEIDRRELAVRSATVSPDGLSVRLVVDGLRPLHVHELDAAGVRDRGGRPLLHSWAAYTLVRQPQGETVAGASPAVDDRPPNVVVIMADDLGFGDVGCFGGTTIRTPNLDRMAAEGARFASFLVGQSVCTASRAALLTGCYPNRVGMAGALNHTSPTGIAPAERLLSERLKRRGYATACYGKWHLGLHPPFWPTFRGFDEFFGIPYSNDNGPLHPTVPTMPPLPLYDGVEVVEIDPDQGLFTRRFTERAVDFIARHRERPFFLYVPHVMPHVPIFASPEWHGRSGRGLYADVVEELDASVGTILEALKTHGIDDRTLVVFLSDNGPFLSYGEHAGSAAPFREGKLTTFEGGMRVPCIARWPGHVPAGRVVDEIVSTLDLCATVAALAGAEPVDRRADGLDVRPLLFGAPDGHGRETFLYYSGTELQAVREGDWKLHLPHDYLTVAAEPGRDGKPSNFGRMKPESMALSGVRGIASRHGYRVESLPLSLYNLADDPGEMHDVAAAHPDVVARLEAVAAEARADLGDSLTGVRGRGVRPVGDVRPPVPPGVERISDIEYAQPQVPKRLSLLLDLYRPQERPEAGVPCVLWIHGGGWRQGSKEQCPLVWLAGEGVAVASINYRLTHLATWPAQAEDCQAAFDWLVAHAPAHGIDPQRIVVAGGSAGGHLAALLGTTGSDEPRPRGVIDIFGPAHLPSMVSDTPGGQFAAGVIARLLGGPVAQRGALASAASPITHVSADDPPFLILHGDRDALVPLEQSERLQAALDAVGVPAELRVLRGAGHGGPPFDTADVRRAVRDFIDRSTVAPAGR
jgi:arylsulfatase A-like enzyme/dienelactone hydrolase/glucose/arabinose dehydrogenase